MSTYWIDGARGIDSDSGTSMSTPWKTLAPLLAALPARRTGRGDTVMIRSGLTYPGNISGIPVGFAREAPLVFGAWGDGERPIIEGYKILNIAASWTAHAAGVWKIPLTLAAGAAGTYAGNTASAEYDVGFLKVDGVIKGVQRNTLASVASGAAWDFYSDASFLYVNAAGNPTSLASDIRAAVRDTGFTGQSRVSVIGLDFVGFGRHGYRHSGAGTASISHTEILDNRFREIGGCHLNVGSTTDFSRLGNGAELWINTDGSHVAGNEFSDIYDVAITLQGSGQNTGLNGWSDVEIDHNLIWNCNQTFEVWSSNPQAAINPAGHRRVSFHDNIAMNGGHSWGDVVRTDTDGKANHFMSYGLDFPVDIDVHHNILHLAKETYSLHSAAGGVIPNGWKSHDNTIILEPGTAMQKMNPGGAYMGTIETAQAWASSKGTETGSKFAIIPAEFAIDTVPASQRVERLLSFLTAEASLSGDTARRALSQANRAFGRAAIGLDRLSAITRGGDHSAGLVPDSWYWPAHNTTGGLSTSSLETNKFKGMSWTAPASGYLDQLAFNVTVAGDAAAVVRTGIYRQEGGVFRLASDNGLTSVSSVGQKIVTLATPIWVREGEVLWLGLACPASNATQPTITGVSSANGGPANPLLHIPHSAGNLAYVFSAKISARAFNATGAFPAIAPFGLSDAAALIVVHCSA